MPEISDLFVDESTAQEGKWMDFGACKLKICFASFGNKEFQKKLDELSKPHRRAMELGFFTGEQALELTQHAYAETVVLDWEGLTDGGVVLPYSAGKCRELFKKNPKFFTAVKDAATDDSNFRAARLEVSKGNS